MDSGPGGRKERGRGRLGDPNRQVKRDDTFVSPCVKWFLFAFNMLFWLVGWGLIALGLYALIEAGNVVSEINSLIDIFTNVSLVFIILGCIIFILAFFGALGALRENVCLLKTFAILLGIIFLLEVTAVIVVFVLSDRVIAALNEALVDEAIIDYRDEQNWQDIIDWFQEEFNCCGVGDEAYKTWANNVYFNCSSPGFEACSVPYSCCKEEKRYTFDAAIPNLRCGAGMLANAEIVARETINTQGCVESAYQSAKDNMLMLGGIAVAIIVPQLTGIILARILAGQVEDQRARWK